MNFEPASENLMNLVHNDQYLTFKSNKANIVFSVCQRGKAANIHFDCDKPSLRLVKRALNEFCDFCFELFDWCTMIMGIIEKPSVIRMVEKCSFNKVADIKDHQVYVRLK